MTLFPEERDAIIAYRMERALATMVEAEDNARLGHWNLVANRLYYSVFYAGNALLLSRKLSAATHAGFIRIFNMQFVKTNEFDVRFGKLISELFRIRQSGDYDDVFDLSEEDVKNFFKPAKEFIQIVQSKLD